jgi:hypothetical protein
MTEPGTMNLAFKLDQSYTGLLSPPAQNAFGPQRTAPAVVIPGSRNPFSGRLCMADLCAKRRVLPIWVSGFRLGSYAQKSFTDFSLVDYGRQTNH